LLWLTRPASFKRFKLAILLVLGVGITIYLAVPTVPPWMAFQDFSALPNLHHIAGEVYNLTIPSLQQTLDTNPIAAMPSLHTAIPTTLSLVAIHHYRWRGLPVVLYTLLVYLAITYLGEHYLLDVVAGIILASTSYGIAYHVAWRGDRGNDPMPVDRPLRPIVLLAVLVFLVSEGVGLVTSDLRRPFAPDDAFITRELDGRSPLADYYRGQRAYNLRKFPEAAAAFRRAVDTVDSDARRDISRLMLGHVSMINGDIDTAFEQFILLPPASLPPEELAALGQRLHDRQRHANALRILQVLKVRADDDPLSLYWYAVLGQYLGQVDRAGLLAAAATLEQHGTSPAVADMAANLRSLAAKTSR